LSSVLAKGEIVHLTLEDAADAVRARRMSPVQLTEACLARIAAVEPRLNAFVTLTADVARAEAREAEGPLRHEGHPYDGRLPDPSRMDP
jgi:Asp-tRNA(Asn)/Glu-tRNA(Gln) amidotransferase A subunit family amidase